MEKLLRENEETELRENSKHWDELKFCNKLKIAQL